MSNDEHDPHAEEKLAKAKYDAEVAKESLMESRLLEFTKRRDELRTKPKPWFRSDEFLLDMLERDVKELTRLIERARVIREGKA